MSPRQISIPNDSETRIIPGGKRFYIAVFLFFNLLINYIDRVNLSVAAPALVKEFHWDAARMGWVFSAYLWTYTIPLIPTGVLLDRIGFRRVSAFGISIWSAAAMFTAAATNFATMCLARLALGAGEVTTFPAAGKVIRQWFPIKERGFATAIFHSEHVALSLVRRRWRAWLVVRSGWRGSFVILGALGFIWLALWLWKYREPRSARGYRRASAISSWRIGTENRHSARLTRLPLAISCCDCSASERCGELSLPRGAPHISVTSFWRGFPPIWCRSGECIW